MTSEECWQVDDGNYSTSFMTRDKAWQKAWNWWVEAEYCSDEPSDPPAWPGNVTAATRLLRAHHADQAKRTPSWDPETFPNVTMEKHGQDPEVVDEAELNRSASAAPFRLEGEDSRIERYTWSQHVAARGESGSERCGVCGDKIKNEHCWRLHLENDSEPWWAHVECCDPLGLPSPIEDDRTRMERAARKGRTP